MGETAAIESLRRRMKGGKDVVLGIGDDAALVKPSPGMLMVLTADMLVEGTHFLRDRISMTDLGYKAMAVNLSDIAAMGAVPKFALISLGLPKDLSVNKLHELYNGMEELTVPWGMEIVGGDMTCAPQIVINIAVIGEARPDRVLHQQGAVSGDLIAVSGCLGGSAAGLALLLDPQLQVDDLTREAAMTRHYRPVPRIGIGQLLAESGMVHAAKDISDGLAKEARMISESSGLGCMIDESKLPIDAAAERVAAAAGRSAAEWALFGGEDYELLFAFAPADRDTLESMLNENGCALWVVGELAERETGCRLIDRDGTVKLLNEGYDHFKSGA